MIGRNPPAHLIQRARSLRRRQTDAEKLLWSLVRDRQLAGFKFRRQYPVEPYILDFYCAELKLAIELDGGQHALPAGSEADRVRDGFLASRGLRILRFSNLQMLKETESVLEHLSETCTAP